MSPATAAKQLVWTKGRETEQPLRPSEPHGASSVTPTWRDRVPSCAWDQGQARPRLGVLHRLLHGHRRGGRAWPLPPPRAPPALTPHPVGLSPPHPPPHAAGCLLPAATPPLPRPQLSWRFAFPPVLSLLSLLTPGGGRTVTAPGGVPGSPRLRPPSEGNASVESESIRVTDGLNRPSWIHRSRFPGFGAGHRMCRPQGQKPSGFPGAQIGSRDRGSVVCTGPRGRSRAGFPPAGQGHALPRGRPSGQGGRGLPPAALRGPGGFCGLRSGRRDEWMGCGGLAVPGRLALLQTCVFS